MRRSHLTPFVLAAGLVLSAAASARAQGDEPRWEVGGLFTALNVDNGSASVTFIPICVAPPCLPITTTVDQRAVEPGFGARVGYNVNRHVTLEAEGNFFPREREVTDDAFTGGRKVQGLFGVKAGRRYENFGIFAKARPGFVHFSAGDLQGNVGCIAVFPRPPGCFGVDREGRTDFAFDLGGVLELYPSPRTILRFDAGDTVLRSGAHNVAVNAPGGPVLIGVPDRTTHNFQGSVGFGFRF